jgi:hypothetical protein
MPEDCHNSPTMARGIQFKLTGHYNGRRKERPKPVESSVKERF